jgi:microcystin degradation protein MlrC
MTMKIEVGEVLRSLENTAWSLIERAMAEGATVADVASAAAGVRVVIGMREKLGRSSAEHDEIARRYLAFLAERLTEIDSGSVLKSAAAASIITGKPVVLPEDWKG